MIIVQGVFWVAAESREQFLVESFENQQISLSETRPDLDVHMAALTVRRAQAAENGTERVRPLRREVSFFEANQVDIG